MGQDSIRVSRVWSSVLVVDQKWTRSSGAASRVLWVWFPVAFMLAVIARESTEAFSGQQTSPMLRPVWEQLFGAVTDAHWYVIHHVLRKCGHFLGYGLLGVTWLRAWLLHWILSLRGRSRTLWYRYSFQMAICCTASVASLDELHQTFLPDRTGVLQDVLLDTMGGIALCTCARVLQRSLTRSKI